MSRIDFWYEFASTYSYPAAMRIEAAAAAAGASIRWRPFLLGPIFAAQGLDNSPFNLFPVKGRYMWRDMERLCAELGLAWRRPEPFPQGSVLAARCALVLDETARSAFSRAVYTAEFGEGRDIAKPATIVAVLSQLGHDAADIMARAVSQPVKDALRANTDEAQRLGIFGAPTMITDDGELFWGNDRLEAALAWSNR